MSEPQANQNKPTKTFEEIGALYQALKSKTESWVRQQIPLGKTPEERVNTCLGKTAIQPRGLLSHISNNLLVRPWTFLQIYPEKKMSHDEDFFVLWSEAEKDLLTLQDYVRVLEDYPIIRWYEINTSRGFYSMNPKACERGLDKSCDDKERKDSSFYIAHALRLIEEGSREDRQ